MPMVLAVFLALLIPSPSFAEPELETITAS